MTQVKLKKLKETAKSPTQATPGSSGYDLYAAEDAVVRNHIVTLVSTGWAMEVPQGFEIQIRPRSGLAVKQGITVINTPGTIDSDYRGEVKVALIKSTQWGQLEETIQIKAGDRIAQMVVCEVPKTELVEVPELSDTSRGSGGFGSTGTK